MSLPNLEAAAGKIRSYPLPPSGFDPRAASPLELRRYGLPQPTRFIDPSRTRGTSGPSSFISCRPSGHCRNCCPAFSVGASIRQDLVTGTRGWWSGGVVHAQPEVTFDWVLGQWNVPDVAPPASGQGNWYSFAWIGIDGTNDLTQIGTVQYVSADASGNLTKGCYAAYEWWPNNWQGIANFPIAFGDTVLGLICMLSPTEAYFSLVNVTSSIHAGFIFEGSRWHHVRGKSGRLDIRAPGRRRRIPTIAEFRRDLSREPAWIRASISE